MSVFLIPRDSLKRREPTPPSDATSLVFQRICSLQQRGFRSKVISLAQTQCLETVFGKWSVLGGAAPLQGLQLPCPLVLARGTSVIPDV